MFIGKFAQRSNLTKTKMVREPKEFFDLLHSSEFEVSDARLVNDDTVEVHYKSVGEFAEQNDKVNVVIAAFTTAYARLKLYDLLDLLQERVLYYDTDSVIYVHEPGKPEPPLGNYLGDLTDELNGDYITSFVSGGPKNYAYRTKNGKTDTKVRGITLDYAATGKLNHDVVRALVHLHVNCNTNAKITVDISSNIPLPWVRPEVTSQTGSDVIIVNSCRFEAFFPTGSDVMTPEVPVSCTCTVFNPTPGSFPPPPLGAMGRGGESDVTNKNDVIYLFLTT